MTENRAEGGSELAIKSCALCGQDFVPNKCQEHCRNGCCQRNGCPNARSRGGESTQKCLVCGSPRRFFKSFAPCNRDTCKGGVYWQSSRGGPDWVARRWTSTCHLRDSETYAVMNLHRPTVKARIHVKYCSLKCYNSVEYGHFTRARAGRLLRAWKAAQRKSLAGTEAPGWRNRYRTEKGYFRDYWHRRKMDQRNLMVYGIEPKRRAGLRKRI